jgi:NADPH:quinone reductase-like Zn-dependent oxidoreductase
MQAVLQDEYGDESTLYVGETEIPSPGEGEVLIRGDARLHLHQCIYLFVS